MRCHISPSPDPITNEKISISEYEGERAILWTSFYTNCPDGVCPALILRLRRAQEAATEEDTAMRQYSSRRRSTPSATPLKRSVSTLASKG